jgi:hypothetical protein
MTGEWKLIVRGFVVAALGAAALMLFIVALSAAYVGKFTISAVSILLACCLAFAFRSCLGPFLDVLDHREAEFSAQLTALRAEENSPGVHDD